MGKVQYEGRRDPRFVAVHRGGLLEPSQHRLLALWAADCVEHVLPLFTAKYPEDDRPHRAIETARAWAQGCQSSADIAALMPLPTDRSNRCRRDLCSGDNGPDKDR